MLSLRPSCEQLPKPETRETQITASWDLESSASGTIETGIGFYDHMLEALAKHSGTCINVTCQGDLHIDGHHTTEDIAITLGLCLREALGDRSGVERFGHMVVPLDEALVEATVDLSGRPYCVSDLQIPAAMLGTWDTELVQECFHALCDNARICLHLRQIRGRNSHHIVEAAFKATARALRQAIAITGTGTPSTKGLLA